MDYRQILADQCSEPDNLELSALVPRIEEGQINLKSKLAQIVIGVRRSGKSTLCQKVLLESGVKFGYVNFDDENFSNLKPEQLNEILETLYRLYGPLDYLFFDEIQNAKEVCMAAVCKSSPAARETSCYYRKQCQFTQR